MSVILITGCSSGIGRAIALSAVRKGFTTVATSRNIKMMQTLEAEGCIVRRLDVTDDSERRQVVEELIDSYGAVDVLVNSAGYGELGPCEEVPLDRWVAQFQTNLFGPVSLTQLVIPGMRSRGYGRIVNVSSMAGVLVLPVGAAYHASKYALEAAMEVLSMEVRQFGIGVSLVEPGAVNSQWFENVPELKKYAGGTYGNLATELEQLLAKRIPRGLDPDRVAAVVMHAVNARRPRVRYRVGAEAHTLIALRKLLSPGIWNRCAQVQFPSLRNSTAPRTDPALRAGRDGGR
jgi:NAD(P)-dependent dehydrogenase (short-subunit alcohol dehydrogenase family)